MKKRLWTCLLTVILVLNLMPATMAANLPFEDVSEKAWYYNDVGKAYESGLFTGVSTTRFSPDGQLYLNQAVALAVRVSQYLESGSVSLKNGTDIWYAPFVDYAKQKGIIGNEYDGRWDQPATRAEMVEIFYAIPGIDTVKINHVDDNAIPDVTTQSEHSKAIYAFYRAGILTGGDGNRFNSNSNIARCEVAAILSRLIYPDQRQQVTLTIKQPPALTSPLTEENLLTLLDVLDPDGAWIIRNAEGSDISWRDWAFGCTTVGDLKNELDTIVHEQLHVFTGKESELDWDTFLVDSENIYIGNGAYITVRITNVFDTLEVAKGFPESLRTDRYDTYVGENAEYGMASRQLGVYGLLDEFAAYCWGENNALKTRGYFGADPNQSDNGYVAYPEFRYYILSYMIYAKDHEPEVYQGIMENDNFRRAFQAIDDKFASVVEQRRSAQAWLAPAYENQYHALNQEMAKPAYQEMLNLLKQRAA